MTNKDLRAEVADLKQLEQALKYGKFQYIYVDERLLTANTLKKDKIIAVPPIFLGDCEDYTLERLKKLKSWGFNRTLAHTVGHIPLIEKSGMKIHGGVKLNITNSLSAEFFAELAEGIEDITLSSELTAARIRSLSCKIPFGIIAYGNLPIMVTRRCPINDGKPCNSRQNCGKFITDRQGKKLKTLCSNTVEILNSDVLTLADKTEDFPTVSFFILKFTHENDIVTVTEDFLKGKKPESGFTRGLYYRGVE